MTNRLAAASSPYLLQHRDNPVDWYEWGDDAFAAARERDLPILLSVGYAACHWCHVMAHESFEDDATAAEMNRRFVNVKVDREERPDVDSIYMDAVQALTGRGGWPMTVFLTPDGRPFYAGTYFPATDRPGVPSFRRVLRAVSEAWADRRDELLTQADRLTEAVRRTLPVAAGGPTRRTLQDALDALATQFDGVHGGFGSAPKFPQAPTLEFLLRMARTDQDAASMLRSTLHAMADGGIYDHLGGGFARYAVDGRWLVPHFEKMLYDNALLARLYVRAWQQLGDPRFRTVAVETLEYILRDLALPGGGFASSEDADSEGVEGTFYVFDYEEFLETAGEHAPFAAEVFGVTPSGNFEGATVLSLAVPPTEAAARHGIEPSRCAAILDEVRGRLFETRSRRIRPALDDKVVTAWNGIALRALAEAGAILGSDRYLEAARRNANFVLSSLRDADGRLMRSWRDGVLSVPGFCEDYAAYSLGLFALYQATGEEAWYDHAAGLVTDLVALFGDHEGPGFYSSGRDRPSLVADPKEYFDNPTPSANSFTAETLLHVAAFTGDSAAIDAISGIFAAAGVLLERHPQSVGHLLAVAATHLGGVDEVAVIGPPAHPETVAMRHVLWSAFRPGMVIAWGTGGPSTVPLLDGRSAAPDGPLAYVCRNFACDAPVGTAADLEQHLDR